MATNARSSKGIFYIQKPFGLGALVQAIDGARHQKCPLSEGQQVQLSIQYETPAKLLGLDETGGILQTRFPVVVGNKLTLKHQQLSELWDGHSEVKISALVPDPDGSKNWQARFDTPTASGNRLRYWEKISGRLGEFLMGNIA